MNTFDIHLQTRKNIMTVVDSLSLDQLNQIPEGLNNNILWNFGHILVAQQLLCYRLSGLSVKVSDDLIEQHKKGSTAIKYSHAHLDEIKLLFIDLVGQLQQDYESGLFKTYHAYTTSYGIQLGSIDEAISFNNAHEALHFGYIMAQRRFVTK